jgi:hypothetical protein
VIKTLDNYLLLEIDLETGRHHQIRAQLSKTGVPIKGILNMEHHVPIRMEELIFMPENWNSFIQLLKKN